MPSDFSRQPRSLSDLAYWKATEFRQFILYIGPLVFKGIIGKPIYSLFLSLHVAMSILLNEDDEKRNTLLQYSREILQWFVDASSREFGETFTSYNVHSLSHLADDVERYGTSLNDLSAFKFENYMQILKKKVRNTNNPVAQVIKRDHEVKAANLVVPNIIKPLISTTLKDSCFQLIGGDFCFVQEIHQNETIDCKVFKHRKLENLYEKPIMSSVLDIFFIKDLNKLTYKFKTVNQNQLLKKVVCLPHKGGFACFAVKHEVEKQKY